MHLTIYHTSAQLDALGMQQKTVPIETPLFSVTGVCNVNFQQEVNGATAPSSAHLS